MSEKDVLTSGFWNPRVKYLCCRRLHLEHTPFTLLLNLSCVLGNWEGQLLPMGQGAVTQPAGRGLAPRGQPHTAPARGAGQTRRWGPRLSKSPGPQVSSWWGSRSHLEPGSKSPGQNQAKRLTGRFTVTRHAQGQVRVQINVLYGKADL